MNIEDYSSILCDNIFSCHESTYRKHDNQLMFLCSSVKSYQSGKTVKFWILPHIFEYFNSKLYKKAMQGIFNAKTRGLKPRLPSPGNEYNHIMIRTVQHSENNYCSRESYTENIDSIVKIQQLNEKIHELQRENEYYRNQINELHDKIEKEKIQVFDEESFDDFLEKIMK